MAASSWVSRAFLLQVQAFVLEAKPAHDYLYILKLSGAFS